MLKGGVETELVCQGLSLACLQGLSLGEKAKLAVFSPCQKIDTEEKNGTDCSTPRADLAGTSLCSPSVESVGERSSSHEQVRGYQQRGCESFAESGTGGVQHR